jgi:hypothetical protein
MVKISSVWPQAKYRLTQESYIGRIPGARHERLGEGAEIVWDGMPGPHMEPLDDQARANVAHATKMRGMQTLDPTSALSLVVGEVDDIDAETEALQARLDALKAQRTRAQIEGRATAAMPPPTLATVPAPVAAPQPDVVTVLPGLPPPMRNAPPPPPI